MILFTLRCARCQPRRQNMWAQNYFGGRFLMHFELTRWATRHLRGPLNLKFV
jgi:hypothetical protein